MGARPNFSSNFSLQLLTFGIALSYLDSNPRLCTPCYRLRFALLILSYYPAPYHENKGQPIAGSASRLGCAFGVDAATKTNRKSARSGRLSTHNILPTGCYNKGSRTELAVNSSVVLHSGGVNLYL
jgi:hypothetical protein